MDLLKKIPAGVCPWGSSELLRTESAAGAPATVGRRLDAGGGGDVNPFDRIQQACSLDIIMSLYKAFILIILYPSSNWAAIEQPVGK